MDYSNLTDDELLSLYDQTENNISKYNNLQLALKVTLNSAYGATGNPYFRHYDVRIASAITTSGQLSIRWVANAINNYFNRLLKTEDVDYIIAVDTDSVYITFEALINKIFDDQSDTRKIISYIDKICEEKIQPFINKTFLELKQYLNAYEQKMFMKREAIANKGIWTAKKRYILNVYNNEGVEYKEPELKVMGLEMIKSSTPFFIREKLEEAIKIIINKDEETFHNFIESTKEEFKKAPLSDIAFPRSVNGIQKYTTSTGFAKKTPIHVRGSIIYNKILKDKKLNTVYENIKEGEKIKFIYLREPNPVFSDVISFSHDIPKEFDLSDYIDYHTQLDKSFIEPLKAILMHIGWSTEKQEESIFSCFS